MMTEDRPAGARTWFITGCSSGLGREMAIKLLARGERVVVTARRLETLDALIAGHADRALACRLDVVDPAQIEAALFAARARFGAIDVLVNNAGYGHLGSIEEVPFAEVRALIETDLFAPIALIKAVLPEMRARRSGQIVNIASVGGLVGIAASGYYCAAKFGLVGLSEALCAEVGHLGIKVTVVEPGPFSTDFSTRSLALTVPTTPDYDIAAAFERAGIADWSSRGGEPVRAAMAILGALDAPDPPLHFIVGKPALDFAVSHLTARLAEFERWSALTLSSEAAEA